jgi:hypothetical protein
MPFFTALRANPNRIPLSDPSTDDQLNLQSRAWIADRLEFFALIGHCITTYQKAKNR